MTQPYPDAPPSYEQAIHSPTSASSSGPSSSRPNLTTSASTQNGIPADHRRSMEDEARPLPAGWVRRFDDKSQHQFFVDTLSDPPRSVWHHPHDDEDYLATLSPAERGELEQMHHHPSLPDIIAMESDDDEHYVPQTGSKGKTSQSAPTSATSAGPASAGASSSTLPPRQQGPDHQSAAMRWGRKVKDKMTATTHEQREQTRQERAKEEQEAYEKYMHYRKCMLKAAQTGEKQYLGDDEQGNKLFVTPPRNYGAGRQYPGSYGGYAYAPSTAYGYGDTRTNYASPAYPYGGRRRGPGYGGGLGVPIGVGLLGGALLGGALF